MNTPTLDTLREQLCSLVETAAADFLEIQQAQSAQQERIRQAAVDAAFNAGVENGRTLERASNRANDAFRAGVQHGTTVERDRILAILDYRISALAIDDGADVRNLQAFRNAIT